VQITYHDGEVVDLSFDKTLHAYRVQGKPVPSATKVLGIINKPALIPWSLKMGAEWLEKNVFVDEAESPTGLFTYTSRMGLNQMVKGIKAAYRGTSGNALEIGNDTHRWIELALEQFMAVDGKFGDDNLPEKPEGDETNNSITAFENWVADNDIHFLSSEEKIYSRTDHYAGTLDCAAVVNGSLCIIDWKTSKAIYPEYHLQNAAYAKAWEDIHGGPVLQTLVLRLDKFTGRYEEGYQSTTEWNKNYETFNHALALFNGLKELR
jgi:hypothetical protein